MFHTFKIDGEELTIVDRLAYFGGCVTKDGTTAVELNTPISKARTEYSELKHLWCRLDIPLKLKGGMCLFMSTTCFPWIFTLLLETCSSGEVSSHWRLSCCLTLIDGDNDFAVWLRGNYIIQWMAWMVVLEWILTAWKLECRWDSMDFVVFRPQNRVLSARWSIRFMLFAVAIWKLCSDDWSDHVWQLETSRTRNFQGNWRGRNANQNIAYWWWSRPFKGIRDG